MGDQVWLMTSRQIEPDLDTRAGRTQSVGRAEVASRERCEASKGPDVASWGTHISSTFGWNIRLQKPMEGDEYG